MEHLYELKKDGKTVGYCEWTEDWGWKYYNDLESENKFTHFMVPQIGLTVHPFVTKDKNGKDVFAGDKVNYVGNKAIIKQNDGDFGYHLEFMDLPAMESIKTGRKVTNNLYREMCKDIELIEDKEDDTDKT